MKTLRNQWMIDSNDAAPEILQEMCDTIANEIQAIVSIMGEGGRRLRRLHVKGLATFMMEPQE